MAKVLAIDEIRRRLNSFVSEWRDAEGYERGEAPQFVRDLLRCYGLTKRTAALYEKRAKRTSTQARGFIDALIPGVAVIEMKSAGEDLAKAEVQALDYLDSLPEIERPQWVITCDFFNFRVLDLFNDDEPSQFTLEDLPRNAERLGFIAGHQVRTFGQAEQEKASIAAAQLMGSLYEEVARAGLSDHEASVFLVRTLFAMYADDAGLWRRDLFYEYLEERTSPDGTDLGAQLSMLYQLLGRPEDQRSQHLDELLRQFPYVNGGVFGESIMIPAFDHVMRDKLIEACAFNWSAISPAVFGSLFQAVKSSEARRALGEHYTTETNILKALEPLFLDELRQRFRDAAYDAGRLRRLLRDMGQIRVLDPACGCGNFLVVAYRELRELELQIRIRLAQLGGGESQLDFFAHASLNVRMEHFKGIEIEEWPAQIATTALYLVDHQANQRMAQHLGFAPEPLPLVKNDCIHTGNALRTDWTRLFTPSENVYVVGNPPFIGQYRKSKSQKADAKEVWGADYNGYLDYVTCWYKKAIDYFGKYINGRFAFVSTNSITQGQPVPALFGPIFREGWRIRFAHRTFPWTSEAPGAAAVHCVIIGFDREKNPAPVLYRYPDPKGDPVATPAKNINAYLVDAPNVLVRKRMKPLSALPKARFGSKPTDGGNLIIEVDEYAEVMADPIAAKYVRPYRMGKELIHGLDRWCLWLKDLDPKDLTRSTVLKQRVEGVKKMRLNSRKKATQEAADTPHLFDEDRQPDKKYLAIPAVFSETRRWATCDWLSPEVIAGNKLYVSVDPDGFAFAVISSSMFITWQKMIGGRLKSDPNFSNTVVWNNFPMPDVSDDSRQEIIDGGQAVLQARALHPERSLAEHYDPLAMSPELLRAHKQLDRAVDRAFRFRQSDPILEERQEKLITYYARMTEQN